MELEILIDEAKDMLKQVHDKATELAKKIQEAKEEEIEKAYKIYKEEQDKKKEEEQKKVQDAQAATQMKMTPGDE